jgi:hypothetical protein
MHEADCYMIAKRSIVTREPRIWPSNFNHRMYDEQSETCRFVMQEKCPLWMLPFSNIRICMHNSVPFRIWTSAKGHGPPGQPQIIRTRSRILARLSQYTAVAVCMVQCMNGMRCVKIRPVCAIILTWRNGILICCRWSAWRDLDEWGDVRGTSFNCVLDDAVSYFFKTYSNLKSHFTARVDKLCNHMRVGKSRENGVSGDENLYRVSKVFICRRLTLLIYKPLTTPAKILFTRRGN